MHKILRIYIILATIVSVTIYSLILWLIIRDYTENEIINIGYFSFFLYASLALFATFIIVILVSKPLERLALKKYYTSLGILQSIEKLKSPLVGNYLKEFDPILLKFRDLLSTSEETIEKSKYKHKNIKNILDTMEPGLILLNQKYKILVANKAALSTFNIKKTKKSAIFTQVYRNEKLTNALTNLNETGPTEMDVTIGDNTYRLHLNIAQGGYTIFSKDITDIIFSEKSQKEYSANVSHALKTPITSIQGFAELMHKGMIKDKEKIALYSHKIYTESHRLINLVDDIMKLASLEKDNMVASGISFIHTINNVLEILETGIEEKNLKVTVNGSGTVQMKQSHFVELVTNLLDNAIKYNLQNGSILIKIEQSTNNKIIVTVKDTGIGIKKEALPFIFDRFYRVPSSIPGNGLGLSIAKDIVKLYDGEIWAKSNKSCTQITVELPTIS